LEAPDLDRPATRSPAEVGEAAGNRRPVATDLLPPAEGNFMTANPTFSESNIPAYIQECEAIVEHAAKPLQLVRYDAARTALAELHHIVKSWRLIPTTCWYASSSIGSGARRATSLISFTVGRAAQHRTAHAFDESQDAPYQFV
jgi:hypothetical protein